MTSRKRALAAPASFLSRGPAVAAAALGLATAAWAVTPAHASDAHAAPKAAAPAASGAVSVKASAATTAAAPKAAVAKVPPASVDDGVALVQARLAAKLGARHSEETGAASPVVRVAARGAAAPAAAPPVAHRAGASAVSHGGAPTARVKAASHAHAPHWSYDGEGGPGAWGRLQPEFSTCAVGKRQSPIDIRDGLKLTLDAVTFDYKPSAFKVRDNGHTIEVELAPGNSIEVMGQRFDLVQFHFHRPSEESIDGRRFDMVAHFVHKSVEGRLAVVAVLIERGAAQPQLQQVWNNLPLEKGDTVAARATIDLERLLPEQRGYFTYMGSLTTPPCSEGVLWMVMKQPVQATAEQLGIFARLYPMNARPIQSASGRLIKESN
jgi:carbonic anhydrase